MTTTKENSAWRELCAMTDTMFQQYGARPAAFKAACAARPDLAAKAIDPEGHPVIQGTAAKVAGTGAGKAQAAPVAPAVGDPLTRAIGKLCATAATNPEDSGAADPLTRAIERMSGHAGQ
jgi:hypothetical protein